MKAREISRAGDLASVGSLVKHPQHPGLGQVEEGGQELQGGGKNAGTIFHCVSRMCIRRKLAWKRNQDSNSGTPIWKVTVPSNLFFSSPQAYPNWNFNLTSKMSWGWTCFSPSVPHTSLLPPFFSVFDCQTCSYFGVFALAVLSGTIVASGTVTGFFFPFCLKQQQEKPANYELAIQFLSHHPCSTSCYIPI